METRIGRIAAGVESPIRGADVVVQLREFRGHGCQEEVLDSLGGARVVSVER